MTVPDEGSSNVPPIKLLDTVDFSTDLINWIPLADVAPVLPLLSLDGNANRVTWSGLEALPSAVLNGRAFFRLRAAPTE